MVIRLMTAADATAILRWHPFRSSDVVGAFPVQSSVFKSRVGQTVVRIGGK